jgi:hypothetical protein
MLGCKIFKIDSKQLRGICCLKFYNIVTYVRCPCPNNVNVAVTIDSAELLQFRSNATMKTNASSQQ